LEEKEDLAVFQYEENLNGQGVSPGLFRRWTCYRGFEKLGFIVWIAQKNLNLKNNPFVTGVTGKIDIEKQMKAAITGIQKNISKNY